MSPRSLFLILCPLALLLTAHRLPAPISEIPTPAPEQAVRPRPKSSSKAKTTASQPKNSKVVEVTWGTGKISMPAGLSGRQDVSSTPAIPQTTTAATRQTTTAPASPQTTGLPTAIPVPNKPGFVYNPFDPTKNRILDVRGMPAGTKVTIPATGKQFIVP